MNIVVYAAVSRIVPIQSILDLIRTHTSGREYAFHKPVGSQIMVSILLMVFWLSAALLPIFSFIRKKASKGDILLKIKFWKQCRSPKPTGKEKALLTPSEIAT